eukprot:149789-Karenia_brevis.AAC.1
MQGKKRKFRSHKDLWRRMERAFETKGKENFKVYKIAAHQSKKEKENESEQERRMRLRNEEADALA